VTALVGKQVSFQPPTFEPLKGITVSAPEIPASEASLERIKLMIVGRAFYAATTKQYLYCFAGDGSGGDMTCEAA